MKKSILVAASVASIMSGSVVAAESSIYGGVALVVQSAEQLSMESGDLFVGFKGESELGNGLIGFYQIEFENAGSDEVSPGFDNVLSYVGIKGQFGTVTLGVQDDLAGFACGGTDIFTNASGSACAVGAVNDALDNAISYAHSVGNLAYAVAATLDGAQDTASDDGMNTIFAIQYSAEDFSLGAQITSRDDLAGDPTTLVIGGSYTMGDITLGLTFADNGEAADNTAFAIAVTLENLAGGTLMAGLDSGDALADEINIEFTRSLSDEVFTGVQFTSTDGANDDVISAYLGYNF